MSTEVLKVKEECMSYNIEYIRGGHPAAREPHAALRRTICGSRMFPFHFCVIIFLKNYYRSTCVSKCLLN